MKVLFTFLLLLLSAPVMAQVKLPQFSISNIPTIELKQDLNLNYDQAFASIKNPMMRDTLRLQYQINLLERLIRRQTEIQRIAGSYETIGVPFKQPAPPESACRQLPVNILCMAFYPESAKYKDLIAERQEEFAKERRRQMDLMMQQALSNAPIMSDNSGGGNMAPIFQAAQKFSPDREYVWSDIRCLAGKCSALLSSQEDPNARFRIRQGENLPDDNGRIKKISMAGVDISFEGKTYSLVPRALEGEAQVTRSRPDTSNIADLLNENLGAEAQNSPAIRAAQNDGAIAPQTVSADDNLPAPMLGVTGLF